MIMTDPFDQKASGLKLPEVSPDIIAANDYLPLHHAVTEFKNKPVVFDWPGEYESKGVIVQAILAYDRPREKEEQKKDDGANRVLLFTIQMDGFKICHLSNLGHKLTTEMLENIGDVDVLLAPVGGTNCLDAKKAHEVIEQLDPRIVIPMYYKIPGLKVQLAELDLFLKEMGLHSPEKEKTLKLSTPSALPQEHTEFKILEPV